MKKQPAVNQILYASWGYEQTNIDYYVIVKVSAASIWVQPIGHIYENYTGAMSATVTPNVNDPKGKVSCVRILKGEWGGVAKAPRGYGAYLYHYDGKDKLASWSH